MSKIVFSLGGRWIFAVLKQQGREHRPDRLFGIKYTSSHIITCFKIAGKLCVFSVGDEGGGYYFRHLLINDRLLR